MAQHDGVTDAGTPSDSVTADSTTAPAPTTTPEASAPAPSDTTANQGIVADHDRVVMLSLHPDGSPAQNNPEIIGDKDFAVDAAKRQFAEQAVSAVDAELRGVSSDDPGEQDPDKLKDAHDAAAAAAEQRAEATVEALYQGTDS